MHAYGTDHGNKFETYMLNWLPSSVAFQKFLGFASSLQNGFGRNLNRDMDP